MMPFSLSCFSEWKHILRPYAYSNNSLLLKVCEISPRKLSVKAVVVSRYQSVQKGPNLLEQLLKVAHLTEKLFSTIICKKFQPIMIGGQNHTA